MRVHRVDKTSRRIRADRAACCSYRTWRSVGALLISAAALCAARPTTSFLRDRRSSSSVSPGSCNTSTTRSASADGSYASTAFVSSSTSAWSAYFQRHSWQVRDAAMVWRSRDGPYNSRCRILAGGALPATPLVRWSPVFTRPASLQTVHGVRLNSSAVVSEGNCVREEGEVQSVEGENVGVILTAAGGRPHTPASRSRISAANKGNTPWNKGVSHSTETRRKIAEGARKAALRRKIALAAEMVSFMVLLLLMLDILTAQALLRHWYSALCIDQHFWSAQLQVQQDQYILYFHCTVCLLLSSACRAYLHCRISGHNGRAICWMAG